ncbi:hypothetical protein CN204_06190 [Sinorhizobium meliloti]|nr:hypothetical protein CDO26_06485 [Sinorhizobium meliloti]RVH87173.1 hypothetical protein CN204_06190 [Sinorhizobium meliloti]RVL03438.1 hypothetical protein CN149_34285 [Sinorhizobium meliloti]RVM29306.1 hypothetical protein CN132_09340 [Sinorhizobium meliloti]RVM43463.1 hypothetical protein CN127_26035 [Sinorhizobium meliloti]
MKLPTSEPLLGDVASVSVECSDCGRARWWQVGQLLRFPGIFGGTPLAKLSARLTCSACQQDGLPGKSISVQALFVSERARVRVEAHILNSREVLPEVSRAIAPSRRTG